jgi:hypothetical protein
VEAKGTAKASASALASGVLFNMGVLSDEGPGRLDMRSTHGGTGALAGWAAPHALKTGKDTTLRWLIVIERTGTAGCDPNENQYHSICFRLFQS